MTQTSPEQTAPDRQAARPFAMVLAISWLYVRYGGLPWIEALFYGIGVWTKADSVTLFDDLTVAGL